VALNQLRLGSATFAQFVCVKSSYTFIELDSGLFFYLAVNRDTICYSSPIIFRIFLCEFPPQSGSSTLTGIFVHLSVVYSQTTEYREGFKYRHVAVREGASIALQQKIQTTN
jgi:hypothetical protein